MKRLFLWPVKAYQYVVSPLLGPSCRFHPTCSDYCLQALEKHGLLRGFFLTIKRLMICHPWSGRHGYDPVPEEHLKPQNNKRKL